MKPRFSMMATVIVMAVASALTWTSTASAKEPDIYSVGEYNTLRLEPAFAAPVNSPQTDHYHVGAAMAAKLDMHITPWIDVFPSVTFVALSIGDQYTAGGNVGTDWAFGLGLRVGRPHDYTNNTGHGWSAYSPWVDGQPEYVRTASLNRFGIQAATGVYFPTSDSRWLWTGPFIGFQQVTDGTSVGGTTGKDNTDARIAMVGWGFEFGATQKRPAPPVVETKTDVPEVVVKNDPTPETNPPPPPPPQTEEVKEEVNETLDYKVQFDFDSAKLRSSEVDNLDNLTAQILNHPGCTVVVEGHASNEGHPWAEAHNVKLSLQRAETVLAYLLAHGAAGGSVPSHLSAKGFGTSTPIADNSTEEGRQANRRVSFDVTFTITYQKPVQK